MGTRVMGDDADEPDPLESPQHTRIMPDDDGDGIADHVEAAYDARPGGTGPAPAPPEPPPVQSPMGTRVLPDDLSFDAPMPGRPVDAIAPPEPVEAPQAVVERFGVKFVGGADDVAELLDRLDREASARAAAAGGGRTGAGMPDRTRLDGDGADRTRVDPGPRREGAGDHGGDPATDVPTGGPSLLLVGPPHTGQRRLARLIARTLAEHGFGDGSVRLAHGAELRGATLEDVAARLDAAGETLLLESFDTVLSGSADPAWMARAIRDLRRHRARETSLIMTCPPDAYRRMSADAPELFEVFDVFRLPELTDVESRMALLHVLADERRVTVGGAALEVVEADLERLSGPGDMVNARLVEAYLERACARYYARVGTAQDRLVLDADDFAGLAEEIEPSLRAPGDVDAFLDRLGNMIGLDEVRQTVDGLVAEARLAAERAAQGLPTGTASRHLIFTGAMGTGKATVAGQVGGIYAALGLLDSGHVVACRPAHLAGRDRSDTAAKVSLHVDQAMGGVLLIQGADRLGASQDAVDELLRFMDERRDKFMVVCTGTAPEIDEFLLANPGFRAEFGAIVEFRDPTARELVRMFQRFAERDLYMLDEELRVELLTRFGRLRDDDGFANAHTVRSMFEATVARQAARLAQAQVNAATAARLSVHDLPEDSLEQALGGLREAPDS